MTHRNYGWWLVANGACWSLANAYGALGHTDWTAFVLWPMAAACAGASVLVAGINLGWWRP